MHNNISSVVLEESNLSISILLLLLLLLLLMSSVNYFNAWDIGRCYIAKARSKFLHIDGRYLRILLALPFEDNIISMWYFVTFTFHKCFHCYTEWLLSRENEIRWECTPLLFSERDLDSFPSTQRKFRSWSPLGVLRHWEPIFQTII